MSITSERLKQVIQVVTQNLSWPTRDPSYVKPSFWTLPMNQQIARPLPSGGGWVDAIAIKKIAGHKQIVKSFVATSKSSGTVDFRWIKNDMLFNPEFIQLTPGIERHVNQTATHPFPCIWRDIFIPGMADEQITLQARNDSGVDQLVFAGVYGWYYPDLQNPNEITRMEGITDVRREF